MALRYIDNLTILADVGESVALPSTLIARLDDGSLMTVSVNWSPSTVDTSTEGEFIFEGTVSGYAHKVLCSVQVGIMEDNPASSFPEAIDTFGLPKKDIQTADVTDVDDYQYFKAKIPRTAVEDAQLQQLREVLADKIILGRDINHCRNAIIEVEKYCIDLQDQIDALEERVSSLESRMDSVEDRVTTLEEETIIDGDNVGSGDAEVFYRKDDSNRELEFRTLTGKGQADVYEDGKEIVIEVDAPVGCGYDVKGDSFKTCNNDSNDKFPFYAESDRFGFADYMNSQMVELSSGFYSWLFVFGQGTTGDFDDCVRMVKGDSKFLIEMKHGDKYIGMELSGSGGRFYDEGYSLMNEQLKDVDVWSDDVEMSRYN